MRNVEKCYSYEELNRELLKEFSEGSEELERLLNYCYDNHIATRACCAGHVGNVIDKPYTMVTSVDGETYYEQTLPYIYFEVPDEQKQMFESLINDLLHNDVINDHTLIEINRCDDINLLTIKYDASIRKFSEEFFKVIRLTLYKVMMGDKTSSGIYDGLFDAYEQISANTCIGCEILKYAMFICKYELESEPQIDNEPTINQQDIDDLLGTSRFFKKAIPNDEIAEFIRVNKKKKGINI